MRHITRSLISSVLFATLGVGCGGGDGHLLPANEVVRARITNLAPAANIGHRGTGNTRPGHPFPENSISSFLQAFAEGADGIELDVELTLDGELVVMHDDTLDRTTTCSGCVSSLTLAQIQSCFLLDGDGEPTSERPPTLDEVYAVIPRDGMVNVELKVFGPACRTPTTGPVQLAETSVAQIKSLRVARRSFFSSFDAEAAGAVKGADAQMYSALLILAPTDETIALATSLGLDAIHPFVGVGAPVIEAIQAAGMQANMWTVNGIDLMNQSLDKHVDSIITDEPGLLEEVIASRE